MSSQQSLTMRGFFEASVSASARDIGQSSLGVGARVSRPISTPDRKKGAGGLDAAHQSFQNVSEASFSSVAGWGPPRGSTRMRVAVVAGLRTPFAKQGT